jgi:hypothetical protein
MALNLKSKRTISSMAAAAIGIGAAVVGPAAPAMAQQWPIIIVTFQLCNSQNYTIDAWQGSTFISKATPGACSPTSVWPGISQVGAVISYFIDNQGVFLGSTTLQEGPNRVNF